jgi:hypothetical protein
MHDHRVEVQLGHLGMRLDQRAHPEQQVLERGAISRRREALQLLAERLIVEETIDGDELQRLLAVGDAPAPPVVVVR